MFVSSDAGNTWRQVSGQIGHLFVCLLWPTVGQSNVSGFPKKSFICLLDGAKDYAITGEGNAHERALLTTSCWVISIEGGISSWST